MIVAPAPTGVKATDEANVQPLLDALSISGGLLILQAGVYKGDFILNQGPTGEQLPRIVGQGERYTRINSLTINGYQLHSSGCYLSDFGFDGQHPTTQVALDLVGAQSVHWDRLGFHRTHRYGIRFYAPTTAYYTEKCSGQANFDDNCATPLYYKADAANGSFNGCGLTMGSEINQSALSTHPIIEISQYAYPYSAPLEAHIWLQKDTQPLILNSSGLPTINFCGNLRIEQLGTAQNGVILDPASTDPIYFAGTLTVQGYAKKLNRRRFHLAPFVGIDSNAAVVETYKNVPILPDTSAAGSFIVLGGAALPSSTSAALGAFTMRIMPFEITQPTPIDQLLAEITSIGDPGSVMRVHIFRDDRGLPENAVPILETTVAADVVGVNASNTFTTVVLQPGWYHGGGTVQSTPATLSSALSTSGAITALPITALANALPNGATIIVESGSQQQNFTLNGAHAAGATSLTINSATPNFAYPIGATVAGISTQPTVRTNTTAPQRFPFRATSAASLSSGTVGNSKGSVSQAARAFGTAPSPASAVPRIWARLAT